MQVRATITKYPAIVGRLYQNGNGMMHANTTGHSKNEVNTLDTRSPDSNLPHSICQGVTSVLSNRSSVCRSRSLVTLPAENTGPTSILNNSTYDIYHAAYHGAMYRHTAITNSASPMLIWITSRNMSVPCAKISLRISLS